MTMLAQLRTLLRLDLDAVDLHKGLLGLVSMVIAIALLVLFGTAGATAALAALFVIAADHPGPLRDRGLGVLVMTGFGSLIALLGVWAGTDHLWFAALLTFVVTAVATLAAGFGQLAGARAMLLAIWAVLALSFGGDAESAISLALAFALGGLIAAAVLWVRTRVSTEPPLEVETAEATRSLRELVRSPLGWFSLVRAGSVAMAMFLGAALFPDHAVWAPLTVLLVMKPKAGETVAVGVLRTLGTLAGVLAAEMVLAISGGSDVIVVIGFLVAAFGMAALQKVNYAIFVLCLTAILVLAQALIGESAGVVALDRLLATVLGAAIAFVGIAIGRSILERHDARGPATHDSAPGPDRGDEPPG